MDGDSRRVSIVEILKQEKQPISGTELAKRFGVSRQIIVQDIALLRAVNKNILSTNKGYLLYEVDKNTDVCRRSIKVRHTDNQILDELYTIVDQGGKVRDVVVEHDIYGQITVDLIINCRLDADNFVKQVKENKTKPLNELTGGVHYHTVEAPNEEVMNRIREELGEKGYLFED